MKLRERSHIYRDNTNQAELASLLNGENRLPMLSVITVVYNAVEDLRVTIASVAEQGLENIEYVVVDGGSTDGTVALLEANTEQISSWITEQDRGIYDAMNKGLSIATGRWFCFMNAGDRFASRDTLKNVFSHEVENYDLIYGDTLEESISGETFYKKAKGDKYLWYGMPTHHQSIFFRTSVAKDNSIEHSLVFRNASDYDFTIRFLQSSTRPALKLDFPISVFKQGGYSDVNALMGVKEYYLIKQKNLKKPRIFLLAIFILQGSMVILRKNSKFLYSIFRMTRQER